MWGGWPKRAQQFSVTTLENMTTPSVLIRPKTCPDGNDNTQDAVTGSVLDLSNYRKTTL
jgi:hypothetical protein